MTAGRSSFGGVVFAVIGNIFHLFLVGLFLIEIGFADNGADDGQNEE